jgi:hypothetical protein
VIVNISESRYECSPGGKALKARQVFKSLVEIVEVQEVKASQRNMIEGLLRETCCGE